MGDERGREAGPDGLGVVDKPGGWTSHDVVAKARGIFGTRRVGHAGTLDPDATGVLLLGVGRATRLLRFLDVLRKTYVGEMVLGVETTTLDAAGDVTATHDMNDTTLADVRAAAAGFVGTIEQVPPMVSAVKVGGRRLHELARQGVEVERRARPVTIHTLEVGTTAEPGVYRLAVVCSSGTYVRSVAADLGHALGGGAHLRRLRRTAVGSFTVDEAVALDALGPGDLRPPADAVGHLPQVVVSGERLTSVRRGAVLPMEAMDRAGFTDGDGDAGAPWAVLDAEHHLVAVYERYGEHSVKPAVVISPA